MIRLLVDIPGGPLTAPSTLTLDVEGLAAEPPEDLVGVEVAVEGQPLLGRLVVRGLVPNDADAVTTYRATRFLD